MGGRAWWRVCGRLGLKDVFHKVSLSGRIPYGGRVLELGDASVGGCLGEWGTPKGSPVQVAVESEGVR